MAMEAEDYASEPRAWSWVQVSLLIAVTLIGLLGFMSSLSTGDIQEVAGSEDSNKAAIVQR